MHHTHRKNAFQKYFDRLREKSKAERKRFTFGTSLGITAVVALVWVTAIAPRTIFDEEISFMDNGTTAGALSPIEQMTRDAGVIFSDIKSGFNEARSLFNDVRSGEGGNAGGEEGAGNTAGSPSDEEDLDVPVRSGREKSAGNEAILETMPEGESEDETIGEPSKDSSEEIKKSESEAPAAEETSGKTSENPDPVEDASPNTTPQSTPSNASKIPE